MRQEESIGENVRAELSSSCPLQPRSLHVPPRFGALSGVERFHSRSGAHQEGSIKQLNVFHTDRLRK